MLGGRDKVGLVANLPSLAMKLSEMTHQLVQTPRGPVFKVPPTQVRHHMVMPKQRFRQHSTPQSTGPQKPRVAEDTQDFQPHQQQVPGGSRQHPSIAAKGCTHKA